MTYADLEQIIEQGEGYYYEFKLKVGSDLHKEMVAFANASGGTILIGVDDDGSIPGIEINNALLSQIQSIATTCDPPVHVVIDKIKDKILSIYVPEGILKPYRCPSGFYIRVGANSQKMNTDGILAFVEKEGRIRFDEQVRLDAPCDLFLSHRFNS
jgi:ATP-dependent DNA helicase RecG